MPVDRTITLWSMAALFVSALAVSGCSTSIADLPGVGLPPDRGEAALNPKEQAKIEAELRAARDRQAASSATTPNPAAK